MTVRLNGATSGYTEIDAPAVAGSNTLVLPTGNGSADQALVTNGSGTLSFADRGRMTLATAQNSTSGTSIDFTGIPSWVKRVTVMFNGVSTSGVSVYQVQLGITSGFQTTGYTGGYSYNGATNAGAAVTTGFGIFNDGGGNFKSGSLVLSLSGANIWTCHGVFAQTGAAPGYNLFTAGTVTLSGTLDRVRITTVNGTDTFDAGSINILYEG